MANINQFKANLVGAGPRNNRFEVFIPRTGNKIQFLCKTASLPGQAITKIEIVHKGQRFSIAGERPAPEDWAVSIYNDTDFSARTALENWMQEIVPLSDSTLPSVSYDYMVDKATVSQLGRDDAVLATYEFFNMYPTTLAAIELDATGGDALTEQGVTFAYSHFERVV